jgi:hypothetical protein
VSLVAAAVCPHPPLLVPAVGAGEPVAAREPARAAVRWLLTQEPELLVVVGDAPETGDVDPTAVGSFAGFGVPLEVSLGARPPATGDPCPLPLSLAVGAWLLGEHLGSPDLRGFGIAAAAGPDAAAAHGERVAGLAGRVALLVMGDGSAARSAKAPHALDERAARFDADASAALAAGDPAALLALDPALGRELAAAGRASWQVLAGAARAGGTARWSGYVTYDEAPYGVGYLVATWEKGI